MSLKSFFLSAPIDGLNLRSSPYTLSPTEAQQLDNYLIYDWGIRETGKFQSITQPDTGAVGQHIFFRNNSNTSYALVCVNNKVFRVVGPGWATAFDKTGALVITSNAWRHCFFRKRIFMVNRTNPGLVYNIGTDALAADTFTGMTTDNASQVCSYKSRLYFVEKDSTSIWYADVEAIAGALTEFDVGSVLEDFGNLAFASSWSVNQGDQNEQLLVIVSNSGEVLIYSGDNPEADNWALLTRVTIPAPIGTQAFIRLGQDILIVTARGVVSLATVVAGKEDENVYYNKSIKLGDVFGSVDVPPVRDPRRPFIYFASREAAYIYALNFERGAWSRILTGVSSGTISAMSFFDGTTPVSGREMSVSYSGGTSHYMDDTDGNTTGHVWRSGYLQIEPDKHKQVDKVRVIGRNILGTQRFSNTLAIRYDVSYENTATDTQTRSGVAYESYTYNDLQPVGEGKRPSLVFTKASAGEQNEITGCDIFYKVGGQE